MMTIKTKIRPADPADAAALARLAVELGYDATPEETAERLRRIGALHGHEVLVAETPDGTILGWTHVFAAPRIESAGFAELGGLVVDALYRRQGIGARLLAAAEQTARRFGHDTVRIRSRVERGQAHEYFEKQAFHGVKTQRVYEKLVAENDDLTIRSDR